MLLFPLCQHPNGTCTRIETVPPEVGTLNATSIVSVSSLPCFPSFLATYYNDTTVDTGSCLTAF